MLLEGSRTILIDPFITDNPVAARSVNELPKLDFIVPTHDHADHFGPEAITLAQRDQAELVAIHEVATRDDVVAAGIKATGMNIGGTYSAGGVDFTMVPAVHSALHGSPAGFIITMDGLRMYHAGDTAYFTDMALIRDMVGPIDVALLPIGGHYTMNVKAAAKAAEVVGAKVTIPIHYNTWPLIQADPQEFAEACGHTTNVVILKPGESHQS